MKWLVYILVVLLGSPFCFASDESRLEIIAGLTALKLNEAISLQKNIGTVFQTPGLAENRFSDFKDFSSKHHLQAQAFSQIWFESHGHILTMIVGKKKHLIDFAHLDEHKATINGLTVKATTNFDEVYQSVKKAFPQPQSSAWLEQLIPPAEAAEQSALEDILQAQTVVLVVGDDFDTDLSPAQLSKAILFPSMAHGPAFKNVHITEFQCLKREDITYITQGLNNGAPYQQAISFTVKHDTLHIQGWGCDEYPFSWNDAFSTWAPPATFTNPNLKNVCSILAQQYAELLRCCKKTGCPEALKASIATENTRSVTPTATTPQQAIPAH